jgi:pseudouridine-5'-phosphate glycosidase
VATHGLPAPANLEAIVSMSRAVREAGSTPAACLVLDGALWIGAGIAQIERATFDSRLRKASVRDICYSVASGIPAGLTVSATLSAASLSGIRVFATGGIGGVHFDATETGDVSADLEQLARNQVITVCSGAKSVLDIPRTLEYLETLGVPVFSYRMECFPAFFLHSSGCSALRLDTPASVARVARVHWELVPRCGVVVGNPVPEAEAIGPLEWTSWLEQARSGANEDGVRGQAVTPHLLSAIAAYSRGATVRANLALLESNARLAAQIACELTP